MKNLLNYSFLLGILIIAQGCDMNDTQNTDFEKASKDINDYDFDPAEITTPFNREVVVYDENEEFSITLNVGSDDKEALDEYLINASFLLKMTYPGDLEFKPDIVENGKESKPENLVQVYLQVKALNLDPQANGFGLQTIYEEEYAENARALSWGYEYNHDSPSTWMYWGRVVWAHTNNSNSDVLVRWYYRTCQFCSMTFDWGTMLYQTNPETIYHRGSVRRIRANVFSNWRNYWVYFKKWEHDEWESL